ncbi:hypothetical protein [Burkholderia sp. PU8-34]
MSGLETWIPAAHAHISAAAVVVFNPHTALEVRGRSDLNSLHTMITRPVSPRSARIVVRRSPIHGRGVFAHRELDAGEVLLESTGERVDWVVAVARPPADPANPHHTFFFDLGGGHVFDGAAGGNSSR